MITGGFGIEYDPKRGVSRAWIYKDGVKLKRWTDTGEPVEPPKIDIETKNERLYFSVPQDHKRNI